MPTLQWKSFQTEDLARAAMHDSAILSWEQGLGKSLAAIAWPLIKGARRILIVAPGGLHEQLRSTSIAFFGQWLTTIETQSDFYAYKLHLPHPEDHPTRFFLITYQALGMNGADEWEDEVVNGDRLVDKSIRKRRKQWLRSHGIAEEIEMHYAVGSERGGITCVVTPTIARLIRIHNSFDCVVIDEGVRLQANDSCVAEGVRMLDPKFRMVLTGTPIKNRLESVFWLCWWASGGFSQPTERWPYPGTSEAREQFANQHLIHEKFITREQEDKALARMTNRRPRKIEKRTSRISNVHRLWKLFAPIIIRRRKTDCGEDIVPKTMRPIYVPPGTEQQHVYSFHLDFPPVQSQAGVEIKRRTQIGMQLNILRRVALCPHDPGLNDIITDATTGTPQCSEYDLTPKMAAVISLVMDLIDSGEQVLVGSPFRAFSSALHRRLVKDLGVKSLLLDGSTDPKRRGSLAEDFKRKKYPVMVAGLKAMSEGYSFSNCSNLILPSYSWAMDENEQFIHRVWRLDSPKPVTIYPVAVENTIDEHMLTVFGEKSDSAQLALDGALFADHVEEMNPAKLLRMAQNSFRQNYDTVDEVDLIPTVARRLSVA